MTTIDVNRLPASAWKNGGGATRTILVSPPGAGFDDFDWRISLADVSSSGDFSRFPGVDRTIMLIAGPGMTLHFEDGRDVSLTTPFAPFAFSGDDVVRSELAAGECRDFNVMTRRGKVHAEVAVLHRDTYLRHTADSAFFFCAQGASHVGGVSLLSGFALHVETSSAEIQVAPQTPDAVTIAVLIRRLETS
jgi:environmental stress-induced protein Ves